MFNGYFMGNARKIGMKQFLLFLKNTHFMNHHLWSQFILPKTVRKTRIGVAGNIKWGFASQYFQMWFK